MAAPYLIGNWKMRCTVAESVALASALAVSLPAPRGTVVLCPSFVALEAVAEVLRGTSLVLGAQDVAAEEQGAFTGEVSARELQELGCRYVIVGHSERRCHFSETDDLVRQKLVMALRHGLTPVLCVGETAEERSAGQRDAVLERQLGGALDGAEGEVVVAYEPVWAISTSGTGETVTAEEAAQAHRFVRTAIERLTGAAQAERTRVIYGGSVTSENVSEFVGPQAMEGALVGAESINADGFMRLVERAEAAR